MTNKILNKIQENNVKKILDENNDFETIQKRLIDIDLGDFVHNESLNEYKEKHDKTK